MTRREKYNRIRLLSFVPRQAVRDEPLEIDEKILREAYVTSNGKAKFRFRAADFFFPHEIIATVTVWKKATMTKNRFTAWFQAHGGKIDGICLPPQIEEFKFSGEQLASPKIIASLVLPSDKKLKESLMRALYEVDIIRFKPSQCISEPYRDLVFKELISSSSVGHTLLMQALMNVGIPMLNIGDLAMVLMECPDLLEEPVFLPDVANPMGAVDKRKDLIQFRAILGQDARGRSQKPLITHIWWGDLVRDLGNCLFPVIRAERAWYRTLL